MRKSMDTGKQYTGHHKSSRPDYWNNVYSGFHKDNPIRASVWNEEATPFIVRLMPFLKHEGVQSIADTGCGDGRNLTPLVEYGFEVMGIDSSAEALNYAKANNKEQNNLELI